MNATASPIYSITTDAERLCLSQLAMEVRDGGFIVEIGTLYGGTTAILAKSAPKAKVVSIDDYSWTPDGIPNTPLQVFERLANVGVKNVELVRGDSRAICIGWTAHIDLLWIDGAHAFEFVYSDLHNFGAHADVIALHDYKNPEAWMGITKAVETFINRNREWHIDQIVDTVCVLRKN